MALSVFRNFESDDSSNFKILKRGYGCPNCMNLNTDKLKSELSGLLGSDIKSIKVTPKENKYSTVYFIKLDGSELDPPDIILKECEVLDGYFPLECANYHDLYKFLLEPFKLNSPKIYGFIKIDHKPLLVAEYISYESHNRYSHENYTIALNWLLKKDKLFSKHAVDVNSYSCIGKNIWVHEQCLDLLKDAFVKNVMPSRRYEEYCSISDFFKTNISILDQGIQTVSHNDFNLWNILFREKNSVDSMYVIDWTFPNQCSVTFDLAYLVHSAPDSIKNSLIDDYRKQIDFPEFDKLFEFSQSLVKLIELSWLTNDIIKEGVDPKIQERVDTLCNDLLRAVRGG